MNDLSADFAYTSINKAAESICGDHVEVVKDDEGGTILVLADGLGSGIKANILSTLTAKILSTMLAQGLQIDECVETMIKTLPVCEERGIAYATFTILHMEQGGMAHIIQYDNPPAILLRNGVHLEFERTPRRIQDKTIYFSTLPYQEGDVFMTFSDGAIHAGIGSTLNFGWGRNEIIKYMEAMHMLSHPAKLLTDILIEQCRELYGGEPGDDTTAAAIRIRRRHHVAMMIGPPYAPESDARVMREFFQIQGKKIISGGTTSVVAARYLGKNLETNLDYVDPYIPPTAKIEGVDLVTEGIVTVTKVLENARALLHQQLLDADWRAKKDGASLMSRMLMEEATHIHFFVGKAVNPAHQNPDLPIGFNIKMRLIEELAECLEKLGKHVELRYN